MKYGIKWLTTALLALLLMLTLAGAVAEGTVYGVATLDQVAVRKKATTKADYWFRIDTGFVCEILGQVEGDDEIWYKVNSTHPDPNKNNTYIGYVRAAAFRPMTEEETQQYLAGNFGSNAPINPGEEEDDYVSDNTVVLGATGEITASGVNFRLAPSKDGGLIGKLNTGDIVELLSIPDTIDSDHWYRVRYNGKEGYIQSPYIRVVNLGNNPVLHNYGYARLIKASANLRETPAGTVKVQWVGKGTKLQIVGVSVSKSGYEWYPVYYAAANTIYYVREDVIALEGYTGGSQQPEQAPSGLYGYVKTTAGGVNLRLTPGGEVVVQIPRGTILPCTGVPESPVGSSYTWYPVQYGELRGYLRGDYVKVCEANGGDVAVTPTPAPTPTPDASTNVYGYIRLTVGGVNLRKTPGGTSLTQLPKDLILPLIGTPVSSGSYQWYPVRTPDGLKGYIRSNCLVLCDAQGNELTGGVVTPTPTPGGGTPTLSTYGYVKITEAGTNLRDNVAGESLTQLKKNTVWPLVGLPVPYGQYTWYPIQANGYTGWVRGNCAFKLSASQELAYLTDGTIPTEAPEETAPEMSSYVITVLDYVNLRTSASRDASAPYKVRTGTVMAYNSYKDVGTSRWYRVVYDGTEVWVLGSCVEIMTVAEYQAWLAQNPDKAPETSTNVGYVITIKGGVNVRNAAGGSTVVGRVDKGTILPYYTYNNNAGGYAWYQIRTASGLEGWIRSDMVDVCDANGGAIIPPTTGGSDSDKPQEAVYTTLRLGSTGTAVYNLVSELKKQGFYTGELTSTYTTQVQNAVIAFQSAKGLTIDGIAGSQTQHALFGTVAPGTTDTSNLSFTFYPVEKIDWYTGGIQQLWAKGANYKVYDVKTGIVWWAHRWSGAAHADIEPLTAADTARLCQIYGVNDAQEIWDNNLWHRRPCLVTIGNRTFACSLFGMPHNPDGDTIANNNMTGQICMHFTNSKGHDSGKIDTYHQQAIQDAYDWAKARYGAK